MAECHVCDDPSLTRYCNHCGQPVCSNHSLPENHDCAGLHYAESLGPDLSETEEGVPVDVQGTLHNSDSEWRGEELDPDDVLNSDESDIGGANPSMQAVLT
jgi:hypothetical protein